ncbi:MAG: hypothetical protein PHU23_17565, partial [Dehalococcoidales bacterium]|nr:hypothetical protein [Dehalococcoidales bacterium]
MNKSLKKIVCRAHSAQKGQILLMTLLFMLLGCFMIVPLLSFMGTGTKTSRVYEEKTDSLYAADSGIEDAKWLIKNDHLDLLATFSPYVSYSPYIFDHEWTYNLPEPVNGKTVEVTIRNEWMPTFTPDGNVAAMGTQEKLLVIGKAQGTTYTIKLAYTWDDTGERDDFEIINLGIWLPSGFEYREDSCSLGHYSSRDYYIYRTPVSTPHASGTALVWSFGSGYKFAGSTFPDIDPLPGAEDENQPTITAEITFEFTPDTVGATPDAVAWVTTNLADVPYAWDSDKKVYKLVSEAGDTEIHAYVAKSEVRELQSAFNGDYYATGQSLLIDDNSQPKYRDLLLEESSGTVTAIPDNARVELAYLYWSGWVKDMANGIFWDYCGTRTLDPQDDNCHWTQTGSDWIVEKGAQGYAGNDYYEKFKGRHVSVSDSSRYLTLKDSLDLSGIPAATVSWTQEAYSTAGPDTIFEDTCSWDNFSTLWAKSGDTYWSSYYNRYRGRNGGGTSSSSNQALTHFEDLSSYSSSQILTLSWNYWSDSISSSQGVDVSISSDGVNFTRIAYFRNDRSSWAPP